MIWSHLWLGVLAAGPRRRRPSRRRPGNLAAAVSGEDLVPAAAAPTGPSLPGARGPLRGPPSSVRVTPPFPAGLPATEPGCPLPTRPTPETSPPASGSPRPLRAARLSTRRCPTANLRPDSQKILRRGRGEGGGRQRGGKGSRRRGGRVEAEPYAREPLPTAAHHCPPLPTRALRPRTTAHHSPTPEDHSPPQPTTAHHCPPLPTRALHLPTRALRLPTRALRRPGAAHRRRRTPRAAY